MAGKLHWSFDIDFDIHFLGYSNSHSSRAGRGSIRLDSNNNCNHNQPLDNNPAPAVGAVFAAGAVGFGDCADIDLYLGRSIPIF